MTRPNTVMPVPSCPLGYTRDDLERYWGAVEGNPPPLWRHLRGQTGVICDGRRWNHELEKYEPTACSGNAHGFVSYVWDVEDWILGRPVTD